MKHMAKRDVPAHQVEYVHSVVCDLCGKSAPQPGSYRTEWGESSYDVEEVTIEYKTGSSFPEGPDITTHTLDMCPDCFKEQLVPWLESHGAKLRVED